MRPHQNLTIAALLLLSAAAVLWSRAGPATPDDPGGTASPRGRAPHRATAAPADGIPVADPPGDSGPQRQAVATPPGPEFVSKDEDGSVIADTARDGLTVLVLHADRTPCAGGAIEVEWRKGFGLYGSDAGRTDASGRFATTVAEFEMLEGIALHDAALGELRSDDAMLPMAGDPRTVCVVVPVMVDVQLRLVDQQQRPIGGGTIAHELRATDQPPREYVLARATQEVTTDARGRAVLRLPVGHFTFTAAAAAHRPLCKLNAEVPAGGRSLTLTLLSDDRLREVGVTVNAPLDLQQPVKLGAFTHYVPEPLLRQERCAAEPLQREFVVTPRDARHFTVAVDELPWRLTAIADGCDWAVVDVAPSQTAVAITLLRSAPKPVARLHCTIVGPDGQPALAEVRVHRGANLVYDDRHQAHRGRVTIELEPGGRICLSAWATGRAPAFAGPIELTAGDREVKLQLTAVQAIRGRVVDAAGNPVAANVNLLRPAGVLRQLGENVAEVLTIAATGDSLGTLDDGRFWFEDVGPGPHELSAQPKGLGWPCRARVQPGDENVRLVLGQGIDGMALVSGTVTEAGSGAPIAGAEIVFEGTGFDHRFSDAQGRFACVVPPGAVTVTAWTRRCVLHAAKANFGAGPTRCDIALAASPPLFVRVLDATGAPLAEVEVGALHGDGTPIELINALGSRDGDTSETDSAGRAELRGLPAGALRLLLVRGEQKKEVAVPADAPREAVFEVRW